MTRASHVGRLRQRLAKAIVQAFANEGIEVRCDPSKLMPAQGAWRSDSRLDCYRWEGWMDVLINDRWQQRSISSWDPMSVCIKGFTVWRERGAAYEVAAIELGGSPSERYAFEGD
jgi:hypothetical protein